MFSFFIVFRRLLGPAIRKLWVLAGLGAALSIWQQLCQFGHNLINLARNLINLARNLVNLARNLVNVARNLVNLVRNLIN